MAEADRSSTQQDWAPLGPLRSQESGSLLGLLGVSSPFRLLATTQDHLEPDPALQVAFDLTGAPLVK